MKLPEETKLCETCSNTITRKRGVFSDIQWKKKRFCSRKCFSINHPKPMIGKISWNRGYKYPPEMCKKFSIAQTGKKYGPMSQERKDKLSKERKGENNPNWNNNKRQECIFCGKKLSRRLLNPRCRDCFGLTVKGDKNWNWKGGITPLNEKIRTSAEYQRWRKSVLKRDNYTCIHCLFIGSKNDNILQVDHIKPFSKYPELRFDISNGRTLCFDCHKKTDSFGAKVRLNYK